MLWIVNFLHACKAYSERFFSLGAYGGPTGFLLGLQFPHLVYEGAFLLPLSGMGPMSHQILA